ncbi:ABC transporter substrate-binding protein [Clostridium sp. SHJSY1]|uniref:ABC transporter substrate-binding protein n=1 Tax=Clostridium sp. SHJSY1 TaxID=2942483 RepID=UPI0028750269|nr:ABC transporter substrate-binding protein [Clostridium sp. SHJSY1]MDS0527397.1 ABC transporter substrate-binding protein [Clostridium sp. SHJSY1]
MKKRIGLLLVLTIFMGVMAGCGKSSDSKSENTTSKEESSSKEGNTAYPRTYKDATGNEVVIKEEPKKIAVGYLPYWEFLLALGQPPVAAVAAENYTKTWDPFKNYDTKSVIDLGEKDINLEKLAEVQPDLILVPASDTGIENLKKIAPVIVLDEKVRMDWRYGIKEIGKIINKTQVAEEKVNEIEKKISDARVKLQEKYKNETVAVISLMKKNGYYCAKRPDFFDPNTGLGLNAPEGYPSENKYEQISMEALSKMNPDHIFLAVFDGSEGLADDLKNDPVWKSLKAVKENKVHTLDGAAHATSILATEYAVNAIVDDLLN